MMRLILAFACMLLAAHVKAYYLPSMNLGLTNFLDGGTPTPGFYWIQFYGYSYSPVYKDERGRVYPNELSQQFNNITTVLLGVVDTPVKIPHAKWGFDISLPITLYNHTNRDDHNRKSTGYGQGDLAIGTYLQFDTVMKGDRKLFQNRLELIVGFPTGKNKRSDVDPGRDCFVINPYWAGTYFFLPHWGLSWRANYAWASRKRDDHVLPGHIFFLNFDLEVETFKNVWVGMNSYYLQQLTDSWQHGKRLLNSKEQAVAVGPGGVIMFPKDFTMVTNLYFEVQAKNRAESIRFIWRLIKHF